MAETLFFYDLETTGLNPRSARIMQFAGQRTDLDLNPIGEPYNIMVRLSDDVLPDPGALVVTGITPQKTLAEGISEPEFAKLLCEELFAKDTVIVGFNNVSFDDEFIRHTLWRNFHDAYEWAYKDGCSRWDMLNVVRMTRALRPEGIEWPVGDEGKPVNKLEAITKANGLDHYKAHDAMSDVEATISVARLIKTAQPKIYDFLYSNRDKSRIRRIVDPAHATPFVYTEGSFSKYPGATTIGYPIGEGPNGTAIVYDLRTDPTPFLQLDASGIERKLNASEAERRDPKFKGLPVRTLAYNKVPAVAPLSVLDADDSWSRLELSKTEILRHQSLIDVDGNFGKRVRDALDKKPPYPKATDPEGQLYDGFLGDADKRKIAPIKKLDLDGLASFNEIFDDPRLKPLLVHYKGRWFPDALSKEEAQEWNAFRNTSLKDALPGFAKTLESTAARFATDTEKLYVLQELQYYAEGIVPYE